MSYTSGMTGPPRNVKALTPPPSQKRGTAQAVIVSVDNATLPRFATVAVNNKFPFESGYILPSGVGPFSAGGTSNPPAPYFYNNSQGLGGSYCTVDLDLKQVTQISTSSVSTAAATPLYSAISNHKHSGNLDPNGFQEPQPVNLAAPEVGGNLLYPNSPLAAFLAYDANSALLITDFPGETMTVQSGIYKGDQRQINQYLIDQDNFSIGTGGWIVSNWYSINANALFNDGTQIWGPGISDGTWNYIMQLNKGITTLVKFQISGQNMINSSTVTTGLPNAATNTGLHEMAFCSEYIGVGNFRFIGYVDGAKVLDYTDTSSPMTNSLSPIFWAVYAGTYNNGLTTINITNVYHNSFTLDITGLSSVYYITMPSPYFPVIVNPGILPTTPTYPDTGAGSYTASVPITLDINGTSKNLWLSQIRFVASVDGQNWFLTNNNPPNSTGQYTALWPGLGAGVSYYIGIQYQDIRGNLSNVTTVGQTATNPNNVGLSMPSGTTISALGQITGYPGAGQSTYGISFTVLPTINIPGSGIPFSTWGSDIEVGIKLNDTGTPGTDTLIQDYQFWTPLPFSNTWTPGSSLTGTVYGCNFGHAYDIAIRAKDKAGNFTNAWPFALGAAQQIDSSQLPNAGLNLIADSDFAYSQFNTSGISGASGFPPSPYWNFGWLDGLSYFVGIGNASVGGTVVNLLGVRPGDSPRSCIAQSEVINVTPGYQYTLSCVFNAVYVTHGSPYFAIMSPDMSISYLQLVLTPGAVGPISGVWVCPIDGSVSQVTCVFNSNACTIASNILMFAEPMFEIGTLSTYEAGTIV